MFNKVEGCAVPPIGREIVIEADPYSCSRLWIHVLGHATLLWADRILVIDR